VISPARYKWVLVGALFFFNFINYADRTAITAVFSLLKRDLGFSDVGLGAIGSCFLWSYALASPLAGYVGDRMRRSRVLLLSLFGWSLATLLAGLATAQWQLLTMRVVLGLVEALYLPAAMALVAEYHGPETRASALGVLNVGNFVGLVGGGTIGGWLGEHHGWQAPLLVLGASGIVLAGLAYFVLPGRKGIPEAEASPHQPVRLGFGEAAGRLIRIPSFLVVAGAGVLTAIGTWIFINWLPLFFRENLGMTLVSAGFLGSSLVSVSSAVSQAVAGVVSDRLARRGAHYRLLMNAVLILCATPTLLAFVLTRNQTVIMIALVAYGVLRAAGDANLIPIVCDLAGDDKRSTAIGLTNMLNTSAGGVGVYLAGFLKGGFGLEGVFAGVAGILALDAVLLLVGCALWIRRDLARAKVEGVAATAVGPA
jgi:MFS family permease